MEVLEWLRANIDIAALVQGLTDDLLPLRRQCARFLVERGAVS